MSSCSSKLSPVISSNEDSVSQASVEEKKFTTILDKKQRATPSPDLTNPPDSARSKKSPYPKESKIAVSLESFKHLDISNHAGVSDDDSIKRLEDEFDQDVVDASSPSVPDSIKVPEACSITDEDLLEPSGPSRHGSTYSARKIFQD